MENVQALMGLVIMAAMIVGFWKVFTKAGKPGWACLVPIYNVICMLQIVGRPLWWFLLMLVPIVNIVVAVIVSMDMSRSFGKGPGFGIGLAFLGMFFYPILGFGDAQYKGPSAGSTSWG
jgi:hypothetical protein